MNKSYILAWKIKNGTVTKEKICVYLFATIGHDITDLHAGALKTCMMFRFEPLWDEQQMYVFCVSCVFCIKVCLGVMFSPGGTSDTWQHYF